MNSRHFIKRSWVEVNIEKLKKNLNIYISNCSLDKDIMAVVKADAYGHGDIEIALQLQEENITNYAVSNVLEAIRLREAGVVGNILVLGYTPIEEIGMIYKYDIIQAIISEDYANKIIEKNIPIKCQIAIDTGMNRIGLNSEDAHQCERIIRRCKQVLNLKGIFTHLCVADSSDVNDKQYTNIQIEKFRRIIEFVEDLELEQIHFANSAAGLWYHNGLGNVVRLGVILYGLKPGYENILPDEIEPILEWKSVISMIKSVHPKETVGYGRTYYVQREMKIATIATGYADGYNRLLSNKGYVLIRGKKAPIVGRICMDQFMVDITDIPNVNVDDEVVLLGKSGDEVILADDMASMVGTIGYEIVCNISKRVSRIYVK